MYNVVISGFAMLKLDQRCHRWSPAMLSLIHQRWIAGRPAIHRCCDSENLNQRYGVKYLHFIDNEYVHKVQASFKEGALTAAPKHKTADLLLHKPCL